MTELEAILEDRPLDRLAVMTPREMIAMLTEARDCIEKLSACVAAMTPLVRKVIVTVDHWNLDADTSPIMRHPFTALADDARKELP